MESNQSKKEQFLKLNFFKKIWFAMTKFEKYPELAALGVKKALLYFTELIVIFSVIYTGIYVYYVSNVVSFEEDNLSLSQKVDKNWKTLDRMILSFGITDEIFAVSSNQKQKVSRVYFLGLMILPIIGWTSGTFAGCVASGLLPYKLQNALGLAIYGMFLAIIIPVAKKDNNVKIVILIAVIISIILNYINQYITIGSGFIIIICTMISAGIMAYLKPIKEESNE